MRQPGSVPRLMVDHVADTTGQDQALRSLERVTLQPAVAGEALISAVNSRLAAVSSATMTGVANLGRHNALSLVIAALAEQNPATITTTRKVLTRKGFKVRLVTRPF